MTDTARRAVVVALLLAAVVSAGVVDRVVGRTTAPGDSLTDSSAAALRVATGAGVARDGVESSAGYCPVATGVGGPAVMTVVLTNTTPKEVSGTITSVSAGGGTASAPVRVPAGAQVGVAPPLSSVPGFLAAGVVLNGGGVGIWEQVASPLGYSTAPCAAAPATQWYFAHGSTAGGDSLAVMLFNPGDAPAVVDVALATSLSGYIEPPAYQGVEVPPGSLVIENVSDHAINDPSVSMAVTALSGSVVAGELEQSGTTGQGGLSAILGSPAAEPSWSFPYNVDETGATVTFNLFNPSSTPAAVTMDVALQQGSSEPMRLKVPARSSTAVVAENETRIPVGSAYAARFVVTRGAGIVVDRQVAISTPGAAVPQEGESAGVPLGGPHWLVPPVPPASNGVWAISLVNTSARRVAVSVSVIDKGHRHVLPRYSHVVLGPGALFVGAPSSTAPLGTVALEVAATGPVAVELDLLPSAAPGVAAATVLPVG